MKNISILTLGSRGDVQPYIPLAKGLMETGYNVHLCTSDDFENFVSEHKIPFRPIQAGYLSLASSDEGKAMMAGNPFAIIKNMKTLIEPLIRQSLLDTAIVCDDADAIICHPKAFGAYDIAEAKKLPIITATPTPVVEAVRAFPNPAFIKHSLGGYLNQKSYSFNFFGTLSFSSIIRQWRKTQLGLSEKRPPHIDTIVNHEHTPVLYGISPSVLSDINESQRFCISGYWWMDEPYYQPDQQLADFVNTDKVVCIGFGSMSTQNPDDFNRMLLEATKNMECRVIILSGWNGFNDKITLPPNVLIRKSIPHSWLFPKMSVVVHHGGAGTTAACLRAGVPMIICPLLGDQFFWVKRMMMMGTAAESAPIKKLSASTLVKMVKETMNNPVLMKNAISYSEKIAKEDGVTKAIRFINSHVGM